MTLGAGLAYLDSYPFEVRYSKFSVTRARVAADFASEAYVYLSSLLAGFEPDIAVIVADKLDWKSRQPYGLPFFNDDEGQIRPGIVVMPAERGEFWIAMGEDLLDAPPFDYAHLLATYPDDEGGIDLQPFFDLVTIHELGHAFERLGGLRLPTFWLSEVFANLCLHAFVATRQPEKLNKLEVLSTVGNQSPNLDARFRTTGYTTLEELEVHYTGGSNPMSPLNYVWYQYRWQRIAAAMFEEDGEDGLVRFWNCFQGFDGSRSDGVTADSLVTMLSAEVSETLGRAIQNW